MKKDINLPKIKKFFLCKKNFLKVIWSKVDNLILKFFPATPTKVGPSRDTNFDWRFSSTTKDI